MQKLPVIPNLEHCTRCGKCVPECPTYQITKNEVFSPRGRIFLYQKQVCHPFSFESCILCGFCERTCPNKVGFLQACLEFYRFKKSKNLFLEKLLSSFASHPLNLLTSVSFDTSKNNELVERIYFQKINFQDFDFVIYLSCDVKHFYPNALTSFLNLIHKKGIEIYVEEESKCCGAHFLSLGFTSLVKKQALKNLKIFKRYQKPLVHFCATCFWMFKRVYPTFFKDTTYEKDFLELSKRSLFVINVLDEKIDDFWDKLKEKTKKRKVLFHLPCHLTEEILLVKNKLEVKNFCCGSPKLFIHPKIRNFQENFKNKWVSFFEKVYFLATLCAGCYFNFRVLLKRPPHIKHWLELL